MSEVLEVFRLGNKKLTISTDDDSEDPREWDNLGQMYTWHRDYVWGDSHRYPTSADFLDSEIEDGDVVLSVYAYIHSGVCLSTNAFSCDWDSGRVGFIFAKKNEIITEFGKDFSTEKIKEILRQEVKTQDNWINGRVYGYEIVDLVTCDSCGHTSEKDEDDSSCFGYIGDDWQSSGLVEDLEDKWQKIIKGKY